MHLVMHYMATPITTCGSTMGRFISENRIEIIVSTSKKFIWPSLLELIILNFCGLPLPNAAYHCI
jgi:hypothetical protein